MLRASHGHSVYIQVPLALLSVFQGTICVPTPSSMGTLPAKRSDISRFNCILWLRNRNDTLSISGNWECVNEALLVDLRSGHEFQCSLTSDRTALLPPAIIKTESLLSINWWKIIKAFWITFLHQKSYCILSFTLIHCIFVFDRYFMHVCTSHIDYYFICMAIL